MGPINLGRHNGAETATAESDKNDWAGSYKILGNQLEPRSRRIYMASGDRTLKSGRTVVEFFWMAWYVWL